MNLILISIVVLCMFSIPLAFADDSLQNTFLHGESAVVSLDISFGTDEYQSLLSKIIIHPQLESINLEFYGDKITLTEPELVVTTHGKHFRILSVPEGIIMYGHENKDLENYKINIYFATSQGLEKFSVITVRSDVSILNLVDSQNTIKIIDSPTLHVLISHGITSQLHLIQFLQIILFT